MRQMGVNCVRVYGWDPGADHSGFLNAAYNNGSRPIYVLINRWVDPNTDWSNTSAIQNLAAEWGNLSATVRGHPAILGYLIGNELNWPEGNRQNATFWSALNRIAGSIRQQDTKHLISTPLADAATLTSIASFDATMTNFNAWCLQSYRGGSFGSLFNDYAKVSAKPLLITEFGMDALDRRRGGEYINNAELQANYVMSLWNQIAANGAVTMGGFVFEWADEWWKSGSAWSQNEGGWATAAFPDGWADEEWWGIHRISTNPNAGVNMLQPRSIFAKLQAAWTARLSVRPYGAGQLQVEVLGGSGQAAVLQQSTAMKPPGWIPVHTNTVPFSTVLPATASPVFLRLELP
jgi:hypothetical protein